MSYLGTTFQVPRADAGACEHRDDGSMRFPKTLKQPSTFIAAAFVVSCALALGAALAGYAVVASATQTVLTVQPS